MIYNRDTKRSEIWIYCQKCGRLVRQILIGNIAQSDKDILDMLKRILQDLQKIKDMLDKQASGK